jgi:hypothetical protein
MKRVRAVSLLGLFGAWLVFAPPFVAVGPNDVADFYTGASRRRNWWSTAWPKERGPSGTWIPRSASRSRSAFTSSRTRSRRSAASPTAALSCGRRPLFQALVGAFFVVLLVRRLTSDESVAVLAGRVTIEYVPVVRATVFFAGIAIELVALVLLPVCLSVPRRVAVETGLPSSAVGREVAK